MSSQPSSANATAAAHPAPAQKVERGQIVGPVDKTRMVISIDGILYLATPLIERLKV